MNRVHCDNALLASCERTYDTVLMALKAFALGIVIGGVWYIGVSIRAGAF
ncbi:hypothetical protein [Paraburkholderia franconis]|nr:hypothetical protein [Paraburkholderia franconis]